MEYHIWAVWLWRPRTQTFRKQHENSLEVDIKNTTRNKHSKLQHDFKSVTCITKCGPVGKMRLARLQMPLYEQNRSNHPWCGSVQVRVGCIDFLCVFVFPCPLIYVLVLLLVACRAVLKKTTLLPTLSDIGMRPMHLSVYLCVCAHVYVTVLQIQ